MTHWTARDFLRGDPEAVEGHWALSTAPQDTVCIRCGFAIAEWDPVLEASAWGAEEDEADYEDSLVYTHTECDTVGTAVTVRTRWDD